MMFEGARFEATYPEQPCLRQVLNFIWPCIHGHLCVVSCKSDWMA